MERKIDRQKVVQAKKSSVQQLIRESDRGSAAAVLLKPQQIRRQSSLTVLVPTLTYGHDQKNKVAGLLRIQTDKTNFVSGDNLANSAEKVRSETSGF